MTVARTCSVFSLSIFAESSITNMLSYLTESWRPILSHKSSVTLIRAPIKGFFPEFLGPGSFFIRISVFSRKQSCFLSSSTQNHAEPFRDFVKNFALDLKRAKFTKSLISGIWFLSLEAGGTLRRQLGEPGRAIHSTCPLRVCRRTL